MDKYCHIKCSGLLDKEYKITLRYEECDCPLIEYEYDAYLFSRGIECWCDDSDYGMCSDCSRKSYAYYRSESDKIFVKCEVCKEEESTCCLSDYFKISK
jgi:hypothetical protein